MINYLFPLSCIIALLLLIGCYYDWKERQVSNTITGLIILYSIPLIYPNASNIGLNHYLTISAMVILSFLGQMGGADLKAIIPIILSIKSLLPFLIVFSIAGMVFVWITKKKNDVPAFIPITLGYIGVILFA